MNTQGKMFRKTKMKDWYEYYQITCPICGKNGGCMINEEQDTVVCIRVESTVRFSNRFSSWVHHLKEKQTYKIDKSQVVEVNEKLSPKHLDIVFRTFLSLLDLREDHYRMLRSKERGLSDIQIKLRGYRSFPLQPLLITQKLLEILNISSLKGVPGFYQNPTGEWTINGSGILIPFRNEKNQIVGMQYRMDKIPYKAVITKLFSTQIEAFVVQQPNVVVVKVEGKVVYKGIISFEEQFPVEVDDKIVGYVSLKKGTKYFWISSANKNNGTSAGPLPIHVAMPIQKLQNWSGTLRTQSAWITEGPLKADISTDMIHRLYDEEEISNVGDVFLAIPGVSSWGTVLPIIENLDIKHVNLAFDADVMSNPDVANALMELAQELKNRGLTANLVIWNQDDGKGLDDLFLSKKIPHFKRIF